MFSPGQNGKGGEKIKQNGKLKKKAFFKRKRPSRDKTRPAFIKEKLIAQPNALWKIDAESHHHAVRSPQKRTRTEAAVDLPCDVSSADAEPFAFAEPFPVAEPSCCAEPLSTVELMPRELRSVKNNNNKRKNYGKNSPTFILKLYICIFIVILKLLYSEMYCTFAYAIYRLFFF